MILNTIEHGISNGRVGGLNTKVRLIIRRANGLHSADAALVMLGAGPIDLELPHERPAAQAILHGQWAPSDRQAYCILGDLADEDGPSHRMRLVLDFSVRSP